jgi:hypothetical protein
MSRTHGYSIFLAILLDTLPLWSQQPLEGPNVFGDLSEERMSLVFESRQVAEKELARQSVTFETPSIANPLEWPTYLIAIARITAVQLSAAATSSRTRVSFHVEQILRGESQVANFDVESRWTQGSAAKDGETTPVFANNYRLTALDRSEPKVGDRYILGYSLAYGDGKLVFVPGVIDMQDLGQAQLIGNMERFLTIETAAGPSNFVPYLEALDGDVPWIRDIALHRLTQSVSCNASPGCAKSFSATVKRQLQSIMPNERQEAVDWLAWIDSVSRSGGERRGSVDGLPVLPDSAIRDLLSSAIEDRNVAIGDRAFEEREMFDMVRTGPPGECFEIVPALRKSAHWLSGEHDLLPAGFPVTHVTGCIPPQEATILLREPRFFVIHTDPDC